MDASPPIAPSPVPPSSGVPAARPEVAPRVLMWVLGLCGFSSTFAMRLADPLVPMLSDVFALPVTTIATLSTAYGMAYALGQPLIGAMGDMLGKARTIRLAALSLTVLLVISGFAASFDMLFVLRALSGVAGGGLIPVAMAAMADRVPVGERQVALARLIMFVTLGQMAGVAGAGVIGDFFGWRAPFFLAAAIAVAGAGAVTFYLKPRPAADRQNLGFGAAVAGYRAVFAHPATIPVMIAALGEGMMLFGLVPFVAAILKERAGVGATEAGLVIAGTGAGAMVYGAFARSIADLFSPRILPIVGGGLSAGAFLMFSLPLPWWTAPIFFLFQGIGFMMMHNPLQVRATELAPAARGSALAVFAGSMFMGQALGPLWIGLLPHSATDMSAAYVIAAGLVGLGFFIGRLIARHGRG